MNYFVDYSGDNAWGKPVPTYRQEEARKLIASELKSITALEGQYVLNLLIRSVERDVLAGEQKGILRYMDLTFMYRLLAVLMTDPEPAPTEVTYTFDNVPTIKEGSATAVFITGDNDTQYKYGQCEECGAKDMYLTAYGHQRDGLLYLCAGCFVNAELDHNRMPEYKDLREHFPHQGLIMPMPADTTMHPEKFLDLYGLETAQSLIQWHDRIKSNTGDVVNYAGININIEELRPAVKEKETILGILPEKGTRQHFEYVYEPDANASPFTQVKYNEQTDRYEPLTTGSGDWVANSLNAAWYGYKLHRDFK